MKLLELEKKYCRSLEGQYDELVRFYETAKTKGLRWQYNEITKAILLRLKTYYSTQNRIKSLLNKRYATAGADFFVETVAFYLNLYLETKDSDLEVHCEKAIQRKRGALRPDISVWRGEEVKAIIECKTQLGWNRNKWQEDFLNRETELNNLFPDAKAFLLVMTTKNWSGFQRVEGEGKKYFALSHRWPGNIEEDQLDLSIINPIEELFQRI